jgi:hypothetical protein
MKPFWWHPKSGGLVVSEPAQDWPFWVFMVAGFSEPEDMGVGDTVGRQFGPAKSAGFKRFHEAMFGVWAAPCGCSGQIARWNAQYPYH